MTGSENPVRGRPFPKGKSGNPRGVNGTDKHQERLAELRAELEATGIPLTARERFDLEWAVALSVRRTRSAHDSAQASIDSKALARSAVRAARETEAAGSRRAARLLRQQAHRASMKKRTTMRAALGDPPLLAGALPGDSWRAWRVLLIASMGEALTDDERAIFTKLTGREREPLEMVETLLVIAGRRSGKSRAMAALSVYLATCIDWSDDLSIGERGLALYLGPTERQAGVVHDYAAAVIDNVDLLKTQVVGRTVSSISLHNGTVLETQAAHWRYSRGVTAIAVCLDECAFFRSNDDSANPDTELLIALKPSLATTGGPMLLTSSPATTEGIVYRLWEKHFGPEGDPLCLVVQTDTRSLNPRIKQSVIDKAVADDPVSAETEYGGAFRQPVMALLAREIVERAVVRGVQQRAALPGVQYAAFVDVSGGSSDSFAAAIGHKHFHQGREVMVIDALFERKPPIRP